MESSSGLELVDRENSQCARENIFSITFFFSSPHLLCVWPTSLLISLHIFHPPASIGVFNIHQHRHLHRHLMMCLPFTVTTFADHVVCCGVLPKRTNVDDNDEGAKKRSNKATTASVVVDDER